MYKITRLTTILLFAAAVPFMAAMPLSPRSAALATTYHFEDFENGWPEGWEQGNFYLAPGGIGGGNAIFEETMIGDDALVTSGMDLGDNPEFSFYYKAYTMQLMGGTQAADPAMVNFRVEISEDGCATWNKIWTVCPEGGDMTHVMSNNFAKITIPLSKFQNKKCNIRIAMDFFMNESFEYVRYEFDNFSIGTPPQADLSLTGLDGPAFLLAGSSAKYTMKIKNLGKDPVSSYVVSLFAGDEKISDVSATEEIGSMEEKIIAIDWNPTSSGLYNLSAELMAENDANASNNRTSSYLVRVSDKSFDKINIGEKMSADYSAPVNYYSRNSTISTIYQANLFGGNAFDIAGLAYYPDFGQPMQSVPITVYVGETEKDGFSMSDTRNDLSLTKVFEGTVYIDSDNGRMELPFNESYRYRGGNLVVKVEKHDLNFYSNEKFHIDNSEIFAGATLSILSDDTEHAESSVAVINAIPVTTFMVSRSEASTVSGRVTQSGGSPLENVAVEVRGMSISTKTDADGYYTLTQLRPGAMTLDYSLYGYRSKSIDITANANRTTTADAVLTPISTSKIEGRVTDALGNAIDGAYVKAIGYRNVRTNTDDNGKFILESVAADPGMSYTITVSAPHYHSESRVLSDVGSAGLLEFTLTEHLDSPANVKVEVKDGIATLTWDTPLHEYRYDAPDAPVNDAVGYEGWVNAVIGSAFPHKAGLKSVSWMTTDQLGNRHPTVNIIITELDAEGWPTRKPIIIVSDVENIDNQLNTYRFPNPITTSRGFFVAINDATGGCLDLVMTEPTDAYPVIEGRYFGCDDFYFDSDEKSRFADLATHFNGNLVLRVLGDDRGELDLDRYDDSLPEPGVSTFDSPVTSYTVYRFTNGTPKEQWQTLATGITSMTYEDNVLSAEGLCYAVAANYASGRSAASVVKVDSSAGIDSVVSSPDEINSLTIYSIDGVLYYRGTTVDAVTLTPGIYIFSVTDRDGNVHTQKKVVR